MANFPPIQVPLVNGVAFSFAHISLEIAGLSFTGGFKSIKYKRERKREKLYANSPDPVAQTIGQNEYEASAVVWLVWWYATVQTIQNTLGKGYGDQPFSVIVNYNASGFAPFQDQIQGCFFDSTNVDQSAGTAPLEREVVFNPLKIRFNGLDDLANPLQATPQ